MSDLGLILTSSKKRNSILSEISTEFIRKSIHLLIAFVPLLADWNKVFTIFLLSSGTLVYAYSEYLRMAGFRIPLISSVTALAARKRDAGHFVLGPVTLGIGALMALVLYPNPAASIAIYALAFGDGLSSLAGRIFGTIRIPFTGGKSLEGSLTCFLAVLTSSYSVTADLPRSAIIASVATVAEALPSKDFDNILLPMITGLVAVFLF
ncbi:MAG: phosphatidate cytidylyltransferase [Spirochaetes bacterium]|nr:phosphatidate cytidylyltransferase [Spirochaetota bacterium]MBU0954742.1 phosphatidate cytidylyltransferase [Spirochaetota bacterium]